MSDFINVTIGAPDNQTAISVSSADRIFVDIAAGFTGSGGGGGGGNTDLTTTRTSTTVTVVSSTGTDATIPAADVTNAGVMTSAMQTKLAGIESGAEVNDTASEILAKIITVDGSGSGLDADTLDGLDASALVPYTGASGDVNLGEYGAQLGNLEFDNTPTNTPTSDGSVFWDAGDGTLQLQMKGGVVQKVGMQQFARVYNDTASSFTKGQVVYISGAQGNRIAAKLAQANSEATSKGTIGFVVETIAAGAEGNIIVSGPLYKLNTLGLTAGANLYLSATTAGGYTETAPQAPDNGVVLGYVERVHGTVGSIYVKVDNGYELEELHDVDLTESKTTPVDADAVLLQDSADSSIWKRLTWANLKATAKAYFDSLYVAGNAAITGATKTKITYDAKGLVTAGADAGISDITGLQTALDGKVAGNAAIVGATKTKITYDAKGLVTAGADATTADIADSSNKRYVTDAQLTVLGNTSGTNTGDQTITLTGDVTGSGTGSFAATIANAAVTLAKMANVATGSVFYRKTTGTGAPEVQTLATLKTDLGLTGTNTGDQTITLTGDVTGSGTGSFAATIANNAVTNGKLAQVATATIKGRTTAGTGNVEDLTGTQTTALLDTFTSTLKGLAPASGGGTTNFLRADGTWAAPAGGGGSGGTVLSPSQITSFQNNYNPTSWGSGVQTLRIDSNSNYNFLSGLTATTGGHRVKFLNVGSFAFGLQDDDSNSTAANRFSFGGQDIIILPGRFAELEYDSTSSRWRLASSYNINFEQCQFVNRVELRWPQTNSGISSVGNGWPIYWTGSASRAVVVVGQTGFSGRTGIVSMTVDNANNSGFYSDNNSISFHDGTNHQYHVYETSIRFSALSDATNRYIFRAGWIDSNTTTPIDGLYIEYSDDINSGQWRLNGYNNSTATTNDSTSAIAADTWYRIRIVAYSNGSAKAYVNGVLVASLASGIPGNNRDFGVYCGLRKTAGTTARICYMDYIAQMNVYAYQK